jgi:hypothetical protein
VAIWATRTNAKTFEGVTIGDTKDKMQQVYGRGFVRTYYEYKYRDLGLTFYYSENNVIETIVIDNLKP